MSQNALNESNAMEHTQSREIQIFQDDNIKCNIIKSFSDTFDHLQLTLAVANMHTHIFNANKRAGTSFMLCTYVCACCVCVCINQKRNVRTYTYVYVNKIWRLVIVAGFLSQTYAHTAQVYKVKEGGYG